MTDIKKIDLNEELKKCKTINDLTGKNGLFKKLMKEMIEGIFDQEMEDYLGYAKNSSNGNVIDNSRNGTSPKTVKSSIGEIELNVPRDRKSDFDPQIVKKRQIDITEFDDKILSMYSKGMSTRDLHDHIDEMYGVNISASGISNIIQKVQKIALDWQNRELQPVYAVV